jgi:hypothetical protein
VQLVRRACHRIVQGARVLRDELRLAAGKLLRSRLLELRLLLRLRLGCLHLEQLPLGGTLGTRLLDRELRRAPLCLRLGQRALVCGACGLCAGCLARAPLCLRLRRCPRALRLTAQLLELALEQVLRLRTLAFVLLCY